MKGIIFIIAFFNFSAFTAAHKFYVSVTEIEHNQKNESLQIISRVFIDDFENVLNLRYSQGLTLDPRDESPGAEDYIRKYLNQKLQLTVNGKTVDIEYLGKEYENDMLVFYIEAPGIKDVKNVLVRNTVLMDMFEEQKNLVHVKVKGKTKSMVLVTGREENTLNF
ncbi:hypothetical protein DHB64_09050 [Antarcticibacterium sp. W02-3]|nr:hypothetical protein [Antarcticibacterium sp. W02-3]